jgi:hypothetical protein
MKPGAIAVQTTSSICFIITPVIKLVQSRGTFVATMRQG